MLFKKSDVFQQHKVSTEETGMTAPVNFVGLSDGVLYSLMRRVFYRFPFEIRRVYGLNKRKALQVLHPQSF